MGGILIGVSVAMFVVGMVGLTVAANANARSTGSAGSQGAWLAIVFLAIPPQILGIIWMHRRGYQLRNSLPVKIASINRYYLSAKRIQAVGAHAASMHIRWTILPPAVGAAVEGPTAGFHVQVEIDPHSRPQARYQQAVAPQQQQPQRWQQQQQQQPQQWQQQPQLLASPSFADGDSSSSSSSSTYAPTIAACEPSTTSAAPGEPDSELEML
jgi:hypothetical protein